jgi:hypothetical protein
MMKVATIFLFSTAVTVLGWIDLHAQSFLAWFCFLMVLVIGAGWAYLISSAELRDQLSQFWSRAVKEGRRLKG